mmetsp:Transcript_2252/g.5415  ORF Transcript_2252/g.5415 Transcript_2252/m.5415 type:complete len:376 (+) Transcript_2252:133-1260(+)|eukprot:CAMPEP_0201124490 /NCGR_PEP_ID=MMETSP0850-20130426/14083_1 /ASSEMBLY_ACC=CAM_ASM_000622 /TAXON_ID=183588 /ORGANISM="Pseudo-nitzschia fraudulenta, Strain WWA7" /LENGTH=375 /DNA_ID=CAMNT_0047391905 /DNA_START=48 /DNA_END=1175 /DNA_ORIENTATION=+
MKLAIASLIVFLILLIDRARAGNPLTKRFNVEGPKYEYDDLQFIMEFTVSDFMKDSMVGYSLYDGKTCKDGGDTDITENSGYLRSRIRTDLAPIGDGSGERIIKVESEINPTQIANSGIYRTDDEGNAMIEYCVRFSVYNMPKDQPQAFEANYLEVPVSLAINLKGGFSVDAAVSNADLVLLQASQDTAVEAYICDSDQNVVPIMPTAQGQTVRVCVSPTPDNLKAGALIRQLESFAFRREIPISTKQTAIEPGTGGVPADQLTVVSCQPGSTVCAFETLLAANFFAGEGIVTGSGQAYLQLGNGASAAARRQLQGTANQVLADKPTSYTVSFSLVKLEALGMDELVSSAPAATGTLVRTALLAVLVSLAAMEQL